MVVNKIQFAGISYILIDKFEYKGVEYLYLFEDITEKIRGKNLSNLEGINAKADFVYKCEDGMYENVVDDELYSKLMVQVNKRNMCGTNEILKNYFKVSE